MTFTIIPKITKLLKTYLKHKLLLKLNQIIYYGPEDTTLRDTRKPRASAPSLTSVSTAVVRNIPLELDYSRQRNIQGGRNDKPMYNINDSVVCMC